MLDNRAQVMFYPSFINEETIRETIEDVGFEATLIMEKSNEKSTQLNLLRSLHGVHKSQVALATEEAEIHYDPIIIHHEQLMNAIEDTGFEAILISTGEDVSKIDLQIDGLWNESFIKVIEQSLQALPGVEKIEIDPNLRKFSVSYKLDLTGPRIALVVGRWIMDDQSMLALPSSVIASCDWPTAELFFSCLLGLLPIYKTTTLQIFFGPLQNQAYYKVGGKHVSSIFGDKVDVAGIGSVTLKFTSGKKVSLPDVAHVPSSVTNFLSVGRFTDHGFEVIIDYLTCFSSALKKKMELDLDLDDGVCWKNVMMKPPLIIEAFAFLGIAAASPSRFSTPGGSPISLLSPYRTASPWGIRDQHLLTGAAAAQVNNTFAFAVTISVLISCGS
ncbi:hypothetical protein LXL04_027583 [Taraxacum kok-saghyz]